MRTRTAAICLSIAAPVFSQELKHLSVASAGSARPVNITAMEIVREGAYPGLVHAKGSVEIKTAVCLPAGADHAEVCDGYILVYADEAIFNEATSEIEAHGVVKVTPLLHEH